MNLALAIPHATRSIDSNALDSGSASLDDRLSALRPKPNPILQQLRSQYPTGCLSADLVQIHQDQFVVRAVVQVDNVALVTALASASTIEVAEDRARARVLEALGLNSMSVSAISATLPLGSPVLPTGSEVTGSEPTIVLASEETAAVKVETTPMSKATKRKSKAAPAVTEAIAEEPAVNLFDTAIPEAVQVATPSELAIEPIVETIIEPIVEPIVEAIVEPIVEPVIEPIIALVVEPIAMQVAEAIVEPIAEVIIEPIIKAVTEPAAIEAVLPIPEESESVEISFENEEVYEYTYEGEEIPLEPVAAIEVAPTPVVVVPAAPIDYGLDLSDAIAQIGMEIDRIGWTKKQGSAYLQQTYGKRTRAELTETELFGFLNYLKSMPAKLQPELSQIPF